MGGLLGEGRECRDQSLGVRIVGESEECGGACLLKDDIADAHRESSITWLQLDDLFCQNPGR